DELGVPLLYFMLSDSLLIFDRAKQTLRLCVNAHIKGDAGAAYDRAVAEIAELYEILKQPRELAPAPLVDSPKIEIPSGNFTRERFEKCVENSKEYIRAGDIIQVVGAQRFIKPFKKTPLDLYRARRTVIPASYMFILGTGGLSLVGAAPELHARWTGGLGEIRPIAGTRRRGATAAEDAALEKELLADEKEKAEHLMLVD